MKRLPDKSEWIDTLWCDGYGSKRECRKLIREDKSEIRAYKIVEIVDRGFCVLVYGLKL